MPDEIKTGRPEFKPTKALRLQVAIAAGGGMSHEQISIALGICRNTLEKHFGMELSEGAYKRRFEVLQAMHKAALTGNVAAARIYLAGEPGLSAPPPAPDAGEKLGKKQRADRDAMTAAEGGDWKDVLTPGTPGRLQ